MNKHSDSRNYRARNLAVRSTAPIFIGGLFKSGTSLLRAMLGQHSAIASGLETYWFSIEWENEKDLARQMELLREFYEIDRDTMKEIVNRSKSSVDFLNNFLGHYTTALNKRRWAEKTPGNIIHMEQILSGWPDAKLIHIKRDPRDVFASLKQAQKWHTVPEFVERWCRFLGTAEADRKRLGLGPDLYMEVRYEQLVLQPRDTMKSVIDFLGEEWEEQIARFDGKRDDYHTVLQLTGKASTTLERLQQPLSKQRVGIWRQLVSEAEIEEIREQINESGLLDLFDRSIVDAW